MYCIHPAGRFNERLVLSLASNPHCLIMDDELNVLPTSSLIRHIAPLPTAPDGKLLNDPSAAGQAELADLKDSLTDTQPAGSLVRTCVACLAGPAVLPVLCEAM
jgi:N-acetyltransferase 10